MHTLGPEHRVGAGVVGLEPLVKALEPAVDVLGKVGPAPQRPAEPQQPAVDRGLLKAKP